MYVAGHGFRFYTGQQILIDTAAENRADEHTREVVRLTEIEEITDPLFGDAAVRRLAWYEADALRYEHNVIRTAVAGNLGPVTQGRRLSDSFAIDEPPPVPNIPLAIVRAGLNGWGATPACQHHLPSENRLYWCCPA